MSPNEHANSFFICPPKPCAESSIKVKLYFSHFVLMSLYLAGSPNKSTAIRAFGLKLFL